MSSSDPRDSSGQLTGVDLKTGPRVRGEGSGSDEGEAYGYDEERRGLG